MEFNAFKHKSPNFEKLIAFGFSFENGRYVYSTQILDGQFEMTVEIAEDGEVAATVIDLATDEPYTLHLVAEASGAFVGQVRTEFEDVLSKIADGCFFRDVFKEDVARGVIEYVRKTYGDELEFLWDGLPTGAIWRRKDNRKWYGIMMIISKRKLGLDCDDEVSVIDLRLDLANDAELVDGKRYFAGYHMNKRTWFTICLDGSVPIDEICRYIDKSYELALKKKK
ncbi:MAG: MmcQ/YjbR family DNA-binding protein [Bacteroides sp.]|nr:MmcQ/YjbR family DNA-binding protein [Bacillota bacterium]MCM1393831.1 MmcQ/YjbR family DNA-binding protein [[Eubacterium] siraeum]MCM1455462.1 MmcQ/YjbR family DNA-binding protein [Bacteroides sp.]